VSNAPRKKRVAPVDGMVNDNSRLKRKRG
jgi:hypothetical protein